MAKTSNNSLSNSLKGKIWLATTALAFFICTFGILSYLITSFLVNDTFYAIVIPFLLLAMTVVVFGWWISNEVVNPVEKLSLLARSLERGTSTSIPKTSGSTETDELLQTLFRMSQQTQKLVDSMESVAQGNLEITIIGNSNSDRISLTFQKLLSKVSESIHAKRELVELQAAVNRLSEEVAPLKNNNLHVVMSAETTATSSISAVVTHLIEQLNDILAQVKLSSNQAQSSSAEVQRVLQAVIQQDENRLQEMNQASVSLKQVPQLVRKISEELSQSAFSANQSIEKARLGTDIAQANLNAVNQLRKQIHESIKRIQKLDESSQEIGRVAKTVEDLAHRTSMVALNASIQAAEMNEEGRGFAIVSEEVERLATRAHQTNKTISNLNKSIQTEINNVGISLENTVSEVASLSKFAIETGNSIEELERYVTQFLHLQEKIVGYTSDRTEETEKAFQTFIDSISEAARSVSNLKESSKDVQKITNSMENLQNAVAHFKSSGYSTETRALETSFSNLPRTFDISA